KISLFNNHSKNNRFEITSNDVVLIIGGSRGLGYEILKKFLIFENCKICIIDKQELDQVELNSFLFYFNCDVSNKNNLLNTFRKIETKIGSVTILINNVGIKHSEPFLKLKYLKMINIINTNLISYILSMKFFLQLSINEKRKLYIINISSVLGLIGPANLSIYSLTKTSIISLHESILHEINLLKNNQIKMLLIKLGQLDTLLFNDVKPPKPFLAPILSHEKMSKLIYSNIKRNQIGEISLPLYGKFLPILKIIPFFIVEFLRKFSEMDRSSVEVFNSMDK
ncbi:NAD(P)-binding protein, partial [Ascoidea rubescens DSM 1968]